MPNPPRRHIVLAAVILAALFVLWQSFYIVDQKERAIVIQLGKPVGDVRGPGPHLKLPFIQNVVFLDGRILLYDAEKAEILTLDKKNLVIDNYARWRIKNPLQFYRSLRTIPRAQARLDDIIYAELRVALGRYSLTDIVSDKRGEIMTQVTAKTNEMLAPYGIEIVDVRIKRTDLPPENERAIFDRMRTERTRQAKQYRSEGDEEAAKIRSEADRERTVLLAEAERQAQILRGEGDAVATKTYGQAFGQSPEFYSFLRSMDAYKESFKENSRMILTPSSRFLKYMR